MGALPPYADTLGIRAVDEGVERLYLMPFGDVVLGRPGFLHGGAIAGLLELAAIATLLRELDDEAASVKPINMSVSFMRGGTGQDTFAAATIARLGGRVANVEAHAWQQDRARPIASAQLNLMVRRA
ncbi:MAG TPA: PaaI family thioesterase [Allosphingosinicella sp.]